MTILPMVCRLMRIGIDGEKGWCFGVDDVWSPRSPQPVDLNGKSFFVMDNDEKQAAFYQTTDWRQFQQLLVAAGCWDSQERLMAMLCLTAIHDIMKVKELLPSVSPDHAPWCGFNAGEVIHDHDEALSYILGHYPDILPSFKILPPSSQKAVAFALGKMNFNHGWFVQAEGPPGSVLSPFKNVMHSGASEHDVAFYFVHWFTVSIQPTSLCSFIPGSAKCSLTNCDLLHICRI